MLQQHGKLAGSAMSFRRHMPRILRTRSADLGAADIATPGPSSWLPGDMRLHVSWHGSRINAVLCCAGQPKLPPETLRAVRKEQGVRMAAKLDAHSAARAKHRFAAFSHGSRACPGQGFATLQVGP